MRERSSPQSTVATDKIREYEARGFAIGAPMMQRAGRSAAEFIHERIKPSSHVVCLVGPGNNGGDGLVAACELRSLGHHVTAVMPVANPHASADAKEALAHWLAGAGVLNKTLPAQPPDLVIDGLFGIGLDRPLAGPWQSIIDTVNEWPCPVFALDLPSGLEADHAKKLGQPVRATWTLSFLAASHATGLAQGKPYCGECWVEDLDVGTNFHGP